MGFNKVEYQMLRHQGMHVANAHYTIRTGKNETSCFQTYPWGENEGRAYIWVLDKCPQPKSKRFALLGVN